MTTLVEADALAENFLSIVDRASDGEEFIVTREGIPYVRLIPLAGSEQKVKVNTMNTPAK